MGAKQIDLTGNKFGRLTVLSKEKSRLYGKTKKRMWLCECDCGKELIANTGALTRGNTTSCGCYKAEKSIENSLKTRHKLANKDAGFRSIQGSYIGNAKNRGLDFNLSFEEFKAIVKSNCYYCGVKPSNIYDKNYYNVKYNGIDRIENDKGYFVENCVPCCNMCNVAKNKHSKEDFLNWIERVYLQTQKNK